MDDPNITMEEYIRLEEEKTPPNFFSCEPTVSSFNDEIDFRISFDESDDEDCTVIFDKNSFSYKIISVNNLKTDSENDNDKVNIPLLPSPEPTVSCFDDYNDAQTSKLDYFKDFEREFPAIVYNDAQTSKLDFLTEPTVSPQHIHEFNLKDETSMSECDKEEQNVLNFNDLFPFNVIYPNDSKSDKDNDDDKVDIEHSSGDLSVKPLPDVINTDVGAYAHGKVTPTTIQSCPLEGNHVTLSYRFVKALRNYGPGDQTIKGEADTIGKAEEGPNYALMVYSSSSSDSEVFNDSTCSKSCLETVKLLKSQYDQLLKYFKKSELMVLGYKIGLESVEEKLEFYKKNESVYVEKINCLKCDIQVGEITIGELRKKLERIQKEKDGIQFNVDKFENAYKSLNKIIECQIVENCKKGLGYNAVPPPYTGNFMPPTPDLSFTSLDEFVNKHVVENSKAKSSEEEPKEVWKNDDALIIEEWVSDSEEENASQTKTKKKTVKPSIAKKEFIKPKQQEKTARKTVK
ncbi:hypothetical protein Tco_1122549 [Tanacetum coccineum]|uniref:Uncharacterized protein n=1 Tax=Tanacetum coccineum TaxID=301880 RepID=A0ABQ5J4J9_9ASTR